MLSFEQKYYFSLKFKTLSQDFKAKFEKLRIYWPCVAIKYRSSINMLPLIIFFEKEIPN